MLGNSELPRLQVATSMSFLYSTLSKFLFIIMRSLLHHASQTVSMKLFPLMVHSRQLYDQQNK
jgi:hypothetical protein